ncbi:histidine kinase N-terminal 7TM domain-containing protein [Ruminococcus sp.]|uniref:sensor histidine kinase n=1 Tax=Ruminococcus sp. TaxID=41978 RepID=UPI0025D1FB5C|nr:histidine kinase N-terminal 7TM domain-containing protein [Ruminococcus sp.]
MTANIISAVLNFLGLFGMLGSVTWILRRGNSNRLTYLFISCQLSIVLWLVSELLILCSVNTKQLWGSYVISNIGISFFGPLWLMLSAEYASAGKRVRKLMNFMPCISLLALTLTLLNPWHYMYYSTFVIGNVVHGPLFYVFQAIYYVCIITGITMICLKHTRRQDKISMQSFLLILSAAIPLGINTLSITGILQSRINITPLFFVFSSLLILIALGKYGLLNINSIAIRDTIQNISSGVIIFDINGAVSYKNSFAAALPFIKKISSMNDFMWEIEKITNEKFDENFESIEFVYNNCFYNLNQSYCANKTGNKVARVVTISDVTEYHELAAAEKKLSLEQERNRIAQEMHDSAGHTFTMISSLAKLVKYEAGKENPSFDDMLKNISEIDGLSRSGVTQLRCTINNLRDDEFMTSVTKAVQTIITAVRGVDVDLCVQGEEDKRYRFCIKEIYDNCRETVTNALRYSEATRIDIILKFLADRIEMYILDNGKGCDSISENNGLRGIRERTEALGGTVKFTSLKGEGFNTVVKIPIKEVQS